MVYYVYLFSFLGCFAYIGCKLRKPDLLTLTIIASGYYSSSLLFGEIYDPEIHMYVEIDEFIYVFYAFLFTVLTIATIINDRYSRKNLKKHSASFPKDFLCFYTVILAVLFISLNALDIRAFFPQEVGGFSASSFGPLYSIYWMSALLLLVASFRTDSIFLKGLSVLFLLTTLLAGSRAYFTAGCFAVLLVLLQSRPEMRLLISIKRLLIIVLGFLFLLVYKNIYQYLLVLDYDMLLAAGTDIDLIVFRLTKGSESVILLNFQHAISLYQHDIGSFSDLVFVKSIPFLSDLYTEGFDFDARTLSDIVNNKYFQTVNYGMASSIWGLFYYVSGPLGCLIFGFTYVCACLYLNLRLKKQDLVGIHLIPGSVLLAFYASRLEIGAILFPFYMSFFLLIVFKLFQIILPARVAKNHDQYFSPSS